MMAKLLVVLIVLLSAKTEGASSAELKTLSFEQKLGAQVSLNLLLRDERNRAAELRDFLQGGPAILVLGYYECPMLCNLVLNSVVESLQELKPGTDSNTRLLFVSIDPREAPSLALAKKKTYAKRFGRPGPNERWHFLTGSEENVAEVAREVGFTYTYDESHKQYAHPSGIVILTPTGRISRYFFGVSYPAAELQSALADAAQQRTGSAIQALLILCSRFVPLTGKFSGIVMGCVRLVAVVTVVALAGFALHTRRVNLRSRA